MRKALQIGVLILLLVSFITLLHFTVYGKTKLSAAENTCTSELVSKFLENEILKDIGSFSLKKISIETIYLSDNLNCCIQSYFSTHSIFSKNVEKQKLCTLYRQFKVYYP